MWQKSACGRRDMTVQWQALVLVVEIILQFSQGSGLFSILINDTAKVPFLGCHHEI